MRGIERALPLSSECEDLLILVQGEMEWVCEETRDERVEKAKQALESNGAACSVENEECLAAADPRRLFHLLRPA